MYFHLEHSIEFGVSGFTTFELSFRYGPDGRNYCLTGYTCKLWHAGRKRTLDVQDNWINFWHEVILYCPGT